MPRPNVLSCGRVGSKRVLTVSGLRMALGTSRPAVSGFWLNEIGDLKERRRTINLEEVAEEGKIAW